MRRGPSSKRSREEVSVPTTTATTSAAASKGTTAAARAAPAAEPMFLFDGCGGPGPQVAGWQRHRIAHRPELLALRFVGMGDRAACRAAGEMVLEPGALERLEDPVQPVRQVRLGTGVRRGPVVRASGGGRSSSGAPGRLVRGGAGLGLRSAAASASRSAASAWRRLSRARVRSARAATWLTPRAPRELETGQVMELGEEERGALALREPLEGALLLAELHDLTGLELAAALGVSHVAARALLTRARESLRQALAPSGTRKRPRISRPRPGPRRTDRPGAPDELRPPSRPDDWSTAHARAQSDLSDRLDGILEPLESAWLEDHLAGCAACRTVADAYEAQRQELRAMRDPVPLPPRDLWARTAAAIEQEPGFRDRRSTRRRWFAPLLAAALVVAVVVGTLTSSRLLFDDGHAARPSGGGLVAAGSQPAGSAFASPRRSRSTGTCSGSASPGRRLHAA